MAPPLRTTVDIFQDALIAAQTLVRRDAAEPESATPGNSATLRGRFALLPQRDQIVTAEHVRVLMEREGI